MHLRYIFKHAKLPSGVVPCDSVQCIFGEKKKECGDPFPDLPLVGQPTEMKELLYTSRAGTRPRLVAPVGVNRA